MWMIAVAGMLAAGGAARAADSLAEDEAAIAKHIQSLHDPSNEVREAAAKALREIVAKYRSNVSSIRTSNLDEAVLLLLVEGRPARGADTLADDEAAIAKHILKLYDPSMKTRAASAKALREIVAKHGTGTSNICEKDSGEARWMEKVKQVKLGMTKAEVRKLLPSLSPNRPDFYGYASGQSAFIGWRLDLHTVNSQERLRTWSDRSWQN